VLFNQPERANLRRTPPVISVTYRASKCTKMQENHLGTTWKTTGKPNGNHLGNS
jgi:hypothetical protein